LKPSREPVMPVTVAASPRFDFASANDLPPFAMKSQVHTLTPPIPRFPPLSGSSSAFDRRSPEATVGSDGAGYRGPMVTNGITYEGDYANQTAYTTFKPLGTLYAPTMRAPGQGCTEGSTFYENATPTVGVWDFCINGNDHFDASVNINSTFVNNYVRNIDGLNRYTVVNTFFPADDEWGVIIYDYAASTWEELYEASSITCYTPPGYLACGYSWSWFEPHIFEGQTCSTLPTISSSEYQESDGPKVTPSISTLETGGDCWSGTSPWVFTLNEPNYQWTVTGGS
jgi:hypothetical protein